MQATKTNVDWHWLADKTVNDGKIVEPKWGSTSTTSGQEQPFLIWSPVHQETKSLPARSWRKIWVQIYSMWTWHLYCSWNLQRAPHPKPWFIIIIYSTYCFVRSTYALQILVPRPRRDFCSSRGSGWTWQRPGPLGSKKHQLDDAISQCSLREREGTATNGTVQLFKHQKQASPWQTALPPILRQNFPLGAWMPSDEVKLVTHHQTSIHRCLWLKLRLISHYGHINLLKLVVVLWVFYPCTSLNSVSASADARLKTPLSGTGHTCPVLLPDHFSPSLGTSQTK